MIATREQLVAEARTWIGTPYHATGAMVKGAGCDCASFMFAVYRACGLIRDENIGVFSDDWFAHTGEEVYMRRILRHAYKVAEAISYHTLAALPGDIVLTRSSNSRIYNHGGIVVEWPRLIHAVNPVVAEADATTHDLWCYRQVCVFDPWEKLKAESAA